VAVVVDILAEGWNYWLEVVVVALNTLTLLVLHFSPQK